MRVLLVSIGYVPFGTPSDKQFVHDLLGALPPTVSPAIWTLNDATCGQRTCEIGGREVPFTNFNRIFHAPLFSAESGDYRPHPSHSGLRTGVELNASLLARLPSLRQMVRRCRPDVLHATDSLGPVGRLIKLAAGDIPMTVTKPTVRCDNGGGNRVYRRYVRASLSYASRLFVFTNAAREQLLKIGMTPTKVRVLPWGVRTPIPSIQVSTRLSIRRRYGCGAADFLCVVTDRTLGEDLAATARAVRALGCPANVRFVFAVRPTRYQEAYASLRDDQIIIEKGPHDFIDLLGSADALLAIPARNELTQTSLTPLVWLQAMAQGVPVIAWDAPGVREVVIDGETGLLVQKLEDVPHAITKLSCAATAKHYGDAARCLVETRFSLQGIARQYAETWDGLLMESSRT